MAPTTLDPNADTMVRVVQRGPVESEQKEFMVLAAAMSVSRYWEPFLRHMNGASGFKPNKTHIEDTGITVVAVEIVLRGMHQAYHRRKSKSYGPDNRVENSAEGQVQSNESVTTGRASSETNGARGFDAASLASQPPTKVSASEKVKVALRADNGATSSLDLADVDIYFPPELFKVDIDDVWGVLALVNLDIVDNSHRGKFDVDRTVVESWFLKWRETSFATFSTQTDFEKVLFPTFAFKDSDGFGLATKWLCQRTSVGNIAEYSPFVHSQGTQWYLHLHLPARVMSKIRITRSQLRVLVSDKIWSVVRGHDGWLLHSDKCACWVVAQYNYLKALEKAGVLCPELDHKKTIMELVKLMKTVEYEEPLNACVKCSKANITSHLGEAIRVGSNFKGITIAECCLVEGEDGKCSDLFGRGRIWKYPARLIGEG